MFGSVFDCNPVPHGATNRLLLENFQQATHIGWLGVPVGSGDRVKRRSSENSAPSGFSARPKMRWNVGWRNQGKFLGEIAELVEIYFTFVPDVISRVIFLDSVSDLSSNRVRSKMDQVN